jgi:glycosyltransferase involved in cell wall biosynthesis
MTQDIHLVSFLTPVFNGGKYLAECIESIRGQEYQNWEYIIVNNGSTDSTLEIATQHAKSDSRIRVVNNSIFVGVIENHNSAFRMISAESRYCKVVSADDWITPDCIAKMVYFAESHPTAGIVGSYQRSGDTIRWKGIPQDVQLISGREICRRSLLEGVDVFGTPTSLLYRSELIRNRDPFFPHTYSHADTSACYEHLRHCDFGFIHEILSAERVHDQQISATVNRIGMGDTAYLHIFLEYGPTYLTDEEFEKRKKGIMDGYFRWLGGSMLKIRGREFWKHHSSRLRELGHPISWRKVMKCAAREIFEEMKHPNVAFSKLLEIVRNR